MGKQAARKIKMLRGSDIGIRTKVYEEIDRVLQATLDRGTQDAIDAAVTILVESLLADCSRYVASFSKDDGYVWVNTSFLKDDGNKTTQDIKNDTDTAEKSI